MSFDEDRKHRVLGKFRSFLSRVPRNDYNKWVRKVDQLEAILNDEKFAHSHSHFLTKCEEAFNNMHFNSDPLYRENQMKRLLEDYSLWELLTPP